jgi:hypothetical protein
MVERVKECAKSALAAFNPLPVLQQSHHCGIACGRVPAGDCLRLRLRRAACATRLRAGECGREQTALAAVECGRWEIFFLGGEQLWACRDLVFVNLSVRH